MSGDKLTVLCHRPLTDQFDPPFLKKKMSLFGFPFGSMTSYKASDAPGTRDLGDLGPILSDEAGSKIVEMHSISCSFPGAPWSIEELRLQDYKALNLWKEARSAPSGGEINLYP
jgi:hypothetical protein